MFVNWGSVKEFTDEKLVSMLYEGSDTAFAEIYRRYWHDLYVLAYRKTTSKETAEELVQELFADIWSRRFTIQITSLRAFLFASLKYSIIDWIDKKASHQKFDVYHQAFGQTADQNTEENIEYQDLEENTYLLLRDFPEKTREIFVMSRMEHLSNAEIADRINLSEKAIEYHLGKVLAKLKVRVHHLLNPILTLILWDIF
jgi:RNA polymerase sigma-70 factor (family 1)